MHSVWRGHAPPGRVLVRCQNLAYSDRVETRRKEVGAKIKQERRRAGYSSQEALAAAIGKHETSVGNAERGSDRVGDAVYEAIEALLGWPIGSSAAYIAGSGRAPWEATSEPSANPDEAESPADDWTPEEVERVREMSADQIVAEARMIARFSGEEAQLRYLRKAATVKLDKRFKPPQ